MSRRGAAVNEIRRTTLDYGVDPYGARMVDRLAGEIASRLQGGGSAVYVGDRGDIPSGQAFTGYAATPQAPLLQAPVMAGNPVTYTDRYATIDTAPADGPYADPVARLLAQRLAVG